MVHGLPLDLHNIMCLKTHFYFIFLNKKDNKDNHHVWKASTSPKQLNSVREDGPWTPHLIYTI